MKRFFSFSTVVLLAACNNPSTDIQKEGAYDPAAAKAEINTSNQNLEQAVAKGDSAAMVALYHPEAKIYPPNMEPIDRAGMGAMTASLPGMGIKNIRLSTTEVSGGPDEVVETGTYEMSDSAKVIDKGKYIVIWKKDNDKWKIYRDIWNSNNPAPASGSK